MQREIKFRRPIYNNDGKFSHWLYWGFIDGDFVNPGAGSVFNRSEQFTGLQDKNGVDIYEGDICKNPEIIGLLKCEFMDGAFIGRHITHVNGLNGQDLFGCIYRSSPTSKYTVIGNTTENPELLSK